MSMTMELCLGAVAVLVAMAFVPETDAFLQPPLGPSPSTPFSLFPFAKSSPSLSRRPDLRPLHQPPGHPFPTLQTRPFSHLNAVSFLSHLRIEPAAFKTSTNAVLRLVSSCSLGLFAASQGLLDQSSLSTLSRLIFAFFQPALLFTNVATTLATPSSHGASLAVLPVFALLQILFGSLYGKGLASFLRLEPTSDEGKELAVCCAFANSGPLPLLFADAFLRLHPTDPTLYPRAVAYISFYLVAWSPLFWTIGATILGAVKTQPAYSSLPSSSSLPPSPPPTPSSTIRKVFSHPLCQKAISPPTLGCLFGAIVGVTPVLRSLFFGPAAPLASLFDALRTMGSAYLPTVLLVLAGSLAKGFETLSLKDTALFKRTAAICVARFVLMPLTALALLRVGTAAALIPSSDKLLAFILLLQACMPCAQNTVVILQLQKRPAAAASMATLVSLTYILAVIPMGFLLSAVLQYVGL